MDKENLLSFVKDLSAGGISGIVAKTVTAPIERVKLLMQTQGTNRDLKVRFKGPMDCFLRVYREQGFFAFWRGNVAGVLRYFPSHSINFAFKDRYKALFSSILEIETKPDFWRVFVCNLSAGGVAGGTALLAAYPLDVVRTKLAADVGGKSSHKIVFPFKLSGNKIASSTVEKGTAVSGIPASAEGGRRYIGTIDCITKVVREGGVVALYRGLPVALFGVVLFKALFMGGYDTSKYMLGLDGKEGSIGLRFLVAQVITSVAGTVCYPIDSVKRRMMMQEPQLASVLASSSLSSSAASPSAIATSASAAEAEVRIGSIEILDKNKSKGAILSKPVTHSVVNSPNTFYKSGTHCFITILKEEGIRGLYHGLSVNLLRGVGGAILLVGYDEAKAFLKTPDKFV